MTEIGGNNPGHTIALPGRTEQTYTFAWAAGTHTGHRRAANEDSYVARSPMFAVADGMGGHSAGDLASAAVVERLDDAITGDFPRALSSAHLNVRRTISASSLKTANLAWGRPSLAL